MELKLAKLLIPEGANLILGQSHFIKTVEDLYELMVGIVPGAKFGLAFSESSGECLIRVEGNDEELRVCAVENARRIGAGRWRIWPEEERVAFARLSPLIHLIPGLDSWTRVEKRALTAAIRAKGGTCEAEYARLVLQVPRLQHALDRIGRSGATSSRGTRS